LCSQNKKALFLKISDSLSGDPIPFSRITFSKTRSIITDENGKCILFYDKSKKLDTIEVIAGGFYASKRVVDVDKNFLHIKLFPEPNSLSAIEVTATPVKNCFKRKTPKKEAGGFVSTDGKRRGAEVATLLEWNSKGSAQLKGVGFFILKNENPDTILLRINVYLVKNERPDSLLISRNLKVFGRDVLKTQSWIYFQGINLSPGISLAVSLESLTEDAGLDKFCFSTSGKKEGWVRYAGYSFWKKVRGGSFLFEPLIVCE
jgi:hypothetical protein